MKLNDKELLSYIQDQQPVKVARLVERFDVTKMTVHRHLNSLIDQGKLKKIGSPPHTRYVITTITPPLHQYQQEIHTALEQHRWQIDDQGNELSGATGFTTWCQTRNLDPDQQSQQRFTYFTQIESLREHGSLVATQKLTDYPDPTIDQLWYGELYAWPQFGKTKRGTTMHIAKTKPSNAIFNQIVQHTAPKVRTLIDHLAIDALCFIEPTASRSRQIMHYVKENMRFDLPVLPLQKMPGYFPPQKSLSSRAKRIANAKSSFFLDTYDQQHEHVLLIDDAVGSGATLNEVARKVKNKQITDQTSGFSITGTANGLLDEMQTFEVLQTV